MWKWYLQFRVWTFSRKILSIIPIIIEFLCFYTSGKQNYSNTSIVNSINVSKPLLFSWNVFQGGASFVDHLCYFCLVLLCFLACLFVDALWSPAGKGLTSWLSFVLSNCDVVTFPSVSWVRCGAWLYLFLIFVLFLTFFFLNLCGLSFIFRLKIAFLPGTYSLTVLSPWMTFF